MGASRRTRGGLHQTIPLEAAVYVERYDDIKIAIQREKNMKHWPRARKVRIILRDIPERGDLYDRIAA